MARGLPPGADGPHKGVAIVIGVPHGDRGNGSGRSAPPGSEPAPNGGKVSRDEAYFRSDSERCVDCQMYHPDTGECDKVQGVMDPGDTCGKYFLALKDEESGESPATEASEDESAEQPAGRSGY